MDKQKKMAGKLNREDIIVRAAKKAGMTIEDMTDCVMAFEEAMVEAAMEGKTVCLTGFGKFYLQRHKGHPIQFAKDTPKVTNYLVFKFSASNVLNATLRKRDSEYPIEIQ